nr:hypothetical protein BaRGS_028682 [Batillaria attramentaria]
MARLGVLRQGDVRCFGGTLLVIVFFACVFFFTLTPDNRSVKLDLPRDELIKRGSDVDYDPLADNKQGVKAAASEGHDKDDGKKSGQKNNKNEKHKLKTKWIKDELPDTDDNQSDGKSEAEDDKAASETGEAADNGSGSSGSVVKSATSGDTADSVEVKSDQQKDAAEEAAKAKGTNSETPQGKDSSANGAKEQTGGRAPTKTGKPKSRGSSSKPQSSTHIASSQHKITSLTDLNSTMLINFTSPFIDSPGTDRSLKKIVTWHNPDRKDRFAFKRRPFDGCPVSSCKIVYPLPEGVIADAVLSHGSTTDSPPARDHKDQVFVFYEDGVTGVSASRRLSKSRLIAWLSDTCPGSTPSKRDEYVTELANHVRVHRLGSCGEKISCGKDDPTCAESLSHKYYFLLVLEDDLCKDHVTEVFYRAWQDGMHLVPVVRGGADYVSYFPQGTFINADWFDSAQQLGEYLVELAKNKKLYSEILWRKTHWQRAPHSRGQEVALCQLCRMLNQVPAHRKRYPDLRRWYENNVCRAPKRF